MGRIFLVDYENVRYEGLEGLDMLTGQDEVIIFDTSAIVNFRVPEKKSLTCRAKLRIETVHSGGFNSLDFQLCTYLGYLVRGTKREIVIIARDKMYNAVINYWRDRGRLIKRAASIENFLGVKSPAIDRTNLSVSDDESNDVIILKDVDHKGAGNRKVKFMDKRSLINVLEYLRINCDLNQVIEIVNNEKLSDIHKYFIQCLGVNEGKVLYRELKSRKILY